MRKNILKENVFMERKLNKKVKEEKAITLIALVITIIVLLILASVSIAMLTGENGLLTKATNAKKLTIIGEEKEIIDLAYISLKLNSVQAENKITKDNLKTEIEKSNKQVTSDNSDINGNVVTEESEYAKITFKDTTNWYIVNLTTGKIEKYGVDGEIIENEIIEGNIEIYNIEDLQKFQKLVNEGATYSGYTVKLMADIDLSSVCGEEKGNWTPIGNYDGSNELCFAGTFDGNNYTIRNLYINDTNLLYQGFFGSVKNGSVSNLSVTGTINANSINGGIIAIIRDSDEYSVNNCINNVNVKNATEGGAGGIVGHIRDNAIDTNINKCTNKGDIQVTKMGTYSAGGIVGTVRDGGSCTITECTNEGTVTCSTIGAGGIIGRITYNASDISIIGCNNIGDVTAERQTGGIIGCIDENTQSNTNINIENCKNSGNINSTLNSAGGMVGFIKDTKKLSINNCENSGNVYSINGQNAAGIIGGVGQLTECIINSSTNLSSIIANTCSAGGVIGQIQDGGEKYYYRIL